MHSQRYIISLFALFALASPSHAASAPLDLSGFRPGPGGLRGKIWRCIIHETQTFVNEFWASWL